MRTRLRFDQDGHVYQVVSSSGEIAMPVVDAAGQDPAEVGQQLFEQYRDTPYDFEHEWPLRMAVIVADGVPTHVVAVMHHLVLDGFGGAAMMADLMDRDPVTGEARTPPPQMQPLEQARWQQGPSGQRQSKNAMRYWEHLLRTIPPRRFAAKRAPQQPRYWEAAQTSPAMLLAARALAGRAGVDTGTVILAAFVVAVARMTGIRPVAMQPVVSNRFRPGLANVVAPINQTTLCAFDVGDTTFDEALTHVRRRAFGAYKYAYYDPDHLEEMISRVERDRGEEVDIACYFNDRRVQARDAAVTPADVEDVPTAVAFTLCADTLYVSPDEMRTCLATIESLIVSAALDPTTRTGL
jgi:hypothetical protein